MCNRSSTFTVGKGCQQKKTGFLWTRTVPLFSFHIFAGEYYACAIGLPPVQYCKGCFLFTFLGGKCMVVFFSHFCGGILCLCTSWNRRHNNSGHFCVASGGCSKRWQWLCLVHKGFLKICERNQLQNNFHLKHGEPLAGYPTWAKLSFGNEVYVGFSLGPA